jgi:hypothetical protein
MPPLVLIAAGAVGVVAVARWLRRESRRINAELHPEPGYAERAQRPEGRLVRDPVTGHYQPEP